MTDNSVPSPPRSAHPGTSTAQELQQELDDLRRMITTLPVIEQAKGVLMHRYEIDAHMAFELLSRWSQSLGQRVSVVAEVLLEIAGVTNLQTTNPTLVAELKAQMGGEWRQPE